MEKQNLFGVCPYLTSQKLLSGKWSIYLLFQISAGPVRFNELLRRMPEEMTHTTLSRQLKLLEEEGLIVRTVLSSIPPKVEYTLSDIGYKFQPVLDSLGLWGNEYIDFLHEKKTQKAKNT